MGKVFCVLSSVILTLAAVEGGFRLFGLSGKLSPYVNVRLRTLPQGYEECFGPRVSRPYYENRGGCVQYRFNAAGFRRTPATAPKPPGNTTRIIALGDSFLYGFGVYEEDTFLSRWETALNQRSRHGPFEILNAGIPGADTHRELVAYRNQWRAYGPHRVLLGLNLNDVMEFPTSRLIHAPRLFESPLRQWSHAVDWFVTRAEERRDRSAKEQSVLSSYTPARRQRFLETFEKLRRLMIEDGVAFTVMLFPVFYRLEDYPFRHIHSDLAKRLSDRGVDVIDAYPWFRDTDANRWWITPFDQHPNEQAHAVIARHLESHFGESALRLSHLAH